MQHSCPRCGTATYRVSFPLWLRPLRLMRPGLRRLRCHICGWEGIRDASGARDKERASGQDVDDPDDLSLPGSMP